MKVSSEELEAYAKHGDGIVRRVTTRVDVSGLRAARAKMQKVSAEIESGHATRIDLLHSIWKAMSFFDDSFTQGMQRLLKEKHE